jgi:hypothetical protein
MMVYGGVEVEIHVFLTSALDASEWSASRSCHFSPEERAHGTYWIEGWVGPRAGRNDTEASSVLPMLSPAGICLLHLQSREREEKRDWERKGNEADCRTV